MIDKKFSKSFDECLQQAYLFYDGFLIDAADFSVASPLFAPPFASDFLADIEYADDLPTNEDDLNEQTLFTQAVEETMESAREHYRKLLLYINFAWPNDKAIAKAFGSNLYEKARNNTLKLINLLQDSYNDVNSITYKTHLIAAGFVQADIDLLGNLADDLTTKNRAQEKFMRLSFKRSEARIVAFNKVWDTMVKLSDASKVIFKDSPAKVEYYLLYPETPTSNPPGVPVLNYAPQGFSWAEVPTATSYQLEYKAIDAEDWIELYAGPLPGDPVPFNPGNGEWVARLRARNSGGYGDWSEEIVVSIGLQPPQIWELVYNPSTNKVTLQWHASIGAEFHDVYQSVVPLGQPAGAFTMIQSVSGQVYQHDVTTYDVREYYYVIARNASGSSDPSEVVSVDVAAS
jgi:hypothetical protein